MFFDTIITTATANPVLFLSLSVLFACTTISFALWLNRLYGQLHQQQVEHSRSTAEQQALRDKLSAQEQQLTTYTKESSELRQAKEGALMRQQESATQLNEARKTIDSLKQERDSARHLRDQANNASQVVRQEAALMRQQLQEEEKRRKDWQAQKEEFYSMTKGAASEIGKTISSKLLDDHKREQEDDRKQREETVSKVMTEFKQVSELVSSLNRDMKTQGDTVSTLWKTLSTPAESGRFAEIGLENSLKSFGLEPGRDFIMQYAVQTDSDSSNKRPDAIIFLPNQRAMVIDSKASKFLLELAEAEGTDGEEQAQMNLKRSMRDHLRILASKDYKGAITKSYKEAGKSEQIQQLFNVMYLPNTGTLERVRRADPEFDERCAQHGIIPIDSSTLAIAIEMCKLEIGVQRQSDNQQRIVEGVQDMLESLGTVLGYASSVGKSLKSAADHYSKFSNSINKRLLPRSRKLVTMGVELPANKSLPHKVQSFSVHEETLMIEMESEEVAKEPSNVLGFGPVKTERKEPEEV